MTHINKNKKENLKNMTESELNKKLAILRKNANPILASLGKRAGDNLPGGFNLRGLDTRLRNRLESVRAEGKL